MSDDLLHYCVLAIIHKSSSRQNRYIQSLPETQRGLLPHVDRLLNRIHIFPNLYGEAVHSVESLTIAKHLTYGVGTHFIQGSGRYNPSNFIVFGSIPTSESRKWFNCIRCSPAILIAMKSHSLSIRMSRFDAFGNSQLFTSKRLKSPFHLLVFWITAHDTSATRR